MNATAFTAPGEGATVDELFQAVSLAALRERGNPFRFPAVWEVLCGFYTASFENLKSGGGARTNLVLLSDRPDGLTDEDLRRIAEVQV